MKVGFFAGKFLPFHLGHLYAAVAAYNQVDKLYVILASNEELDKRLCKEEGIDYIPVKERLSWIGESLKDLDNVHILSIEDYGWADGSAKIIAAIPEKITHVFSSEPSYSEPFSKYYPGAEHVVIDHVRGSKNISGTEIRKDVFKHWDMIPTCARPYFIKRVCIIGTESCGKSTLTKQLAKYFNTNFVHEVGRDYCEEYKNQLTQSHFDSIAMDHWRLQEKLSKTANKILFIDSEAITTNFYAEMYGYEHSKLVSEIAYKQDFDLYLYLEPDVKWVDDGVRFAESERNERNENLKMMFAENHIEFTSISGSYEERFQKAVVEVEKLFTEKEVVEVVEVAEVDKGYFVWDCKIKAKTQSSLMRIDDSPRIEVLRAMTGACLQIVNYFVSITDNWNCKVVVRNDIGLPNGFDLPPRRAAIDAVENFGVEIIECASGWGGTLSPSQEEIIRRSL